MQDLRINPRTKKPAGVTGGLDLVGSMKRC